jgi:mRNA interferase MazF
MSRRYTPDCGDLVWLDFTPHSGHEQAGRRPALVLSPKTYNAKTQLMLCCPITSQVKGYPFEVAVAGAAVINGAVLADQVKSVDWVARHAKFEEKVAPEIMEEVLAKLLVLLGQEPAVE